MVSRPHELRVVCSMEVGEMISFSVVLPVPPPLASDWSEIAHGELSVSIGDEEPVNIRTEKAEQLTAERLVTHPLFIGPQGTFVTARFRYIDDAGNPGAKSEVTVELMDTVPPVAPGSLGIVATGETPHEPPVPDA